MATERKLIAILIAVVCFSKVSLAWFSQSNDWLVNRSLFQPSKLTNTTSGGLPAITLSNGLILRTFSLDPCFTTVEFELLTTRTKFLRALSPEATMTLNGQAVNVGSCLGQDAAHTEFWDPATTALRVDPLSLMLVNYSTSPVIAPFAYVPGTGHSPKDISWPPKGLHLTVNFAPPATLPSNTSSTFAGPFEQLAFNCPFVKGAFQCLTGFISCDNTTVEGQCSWPRAKAVQECAKWPLCLGVQCNPSRDDCQARGAPFSFSSSHYNIFIRSGPAQAASSLVSMHYEIYDGLPVMRKWITVTTTAEPVVVDNMYIEYLRAPNFAPEQITVFQIVANNPTPFSQQVVPLADQSFPGRTQQLWYLDPDWDACCDQELHVSYTYYTVLKVGYGVDVTFGGLTGPGTLVTTSEPFESIGVRLLLHDTTDWERQGLATRRMQELLTPQLMESPLYTMITDISSTAAFRRALDAAAAAGLEFVVVGYGAAGYCGMCPGQLNDATWVAWFKEQVDYARTLGLGVGAYTLMQHNGWGEAVPAAEQVLNRDGSRGGIACFATDWHAAYRASVLKFAQQVGLFSVETDGQYESAACADTGGDHHHNGLAGSWHAQIAATADFNIAMKANGLYQTGADSYEFSGTNKWNHADTDAGYSLPSLWERLSVGRDYVYDSTTTRTHSSGMYGLGDLAQASLSCNPSPGRLVCVDFALASFLGQGVVPDVVASQLWAPNDPDAVALQYIFANWSLFFATHRAVLTSAASLHITRPTSRGYEATAHLLSDPSATERAFVSVYNPTSASLSDTLAVSLYYAGIAPGQSVTVTAVAPGTKPAAPTTHTVGQDGGAVYDVMIPLQLQPTSYALYVVALA